MKTKKLRKKRLGNIEYTESSGNVFADLGIPNPEEALAKAEIAMKKILEIFLYSLFVIVVIYGFFTNPLNTIAILISIFIAFIFFS